MKIPISSFQSELIIELNNDIIQSNLVECQKLRKVLFLVKLKVNDLKKHLKTYDQKDLIQLVTEIYKLNTEVQQFVSIKFLGEECIKMAFEKARKEIKDEFFPSRGDGSLRLVKAKKAIRDFKKLTSDQDKTLDLKLYYVEMGSKFTNTYGDIDSGFYDSMITMFKDVVEACDKDEEFFNKYNERLLKVVNESEGIGWGYSDCINDYYYSIEWLDN